MSILNSEITIPHRNSLLCQTTKQTLSDFETKNIWKYK